MEYLSTIRRCYGTRHDVSKCMCVDDVNFADVNEGFSFQWNQVGDESPAKGVQAT